MNAPWKPAGAGTREPFVAYLCDDNTVDTVRPIAAELGWSPDQVNKGGLRNAVQSLSVSASPQILFVDLSESGDPLGDINALAEVCEPGTVVIAVGQVNDVRLYRDLVASGIQDYLLKPLHPDALRDAFTHAQALLNAPKQVEASTDRPHCSTAVIGTRGGVGASTVAASLAWLLSTREARSTALLDLDVHFGTGALSLDLEPGRGLTDAIENPGRIDGLFIERAMVRASDTLAVLSAEAPISSPVITDGAAFHQLQEEMRAAFETTVVDLPRAMLVQHPHLVGDVQVAVVVTELTLAAARDSIRILSWLKTNAPGTQVFVVANRVHAGAQLEISRKDFEGSIERKIDHLVPFDQKLAAQAAKLGKPLAEAGKSSKTAAPLLELAHAVVNVGDGSAPAAASGKTPGKTGARGAGKSSAGTGSLIGRFGELRGLMPRRAKK
ncbi:pilus assembly protein CpaE [Sphingomonas bacterium]|uniref:pilus assembly protein CpaE n=1 Tax=Sphingomonas bacterium TaxID=1895847 RepID=UPI0015773BB5|nr:pilus assembly protein CpaE [Sphingomonas bacterium]